MSEKKTRSTTTAKKTTKPSTKSSNTESKTSDKKQLDPRSQKATEELIKNSKNILNIIELQKANIQELYKMAKELKLPGYNQLKKNDLIFKIISHKSSQDILIYAKGCLDILPEGFGFLRSNNYLPSTEDIYVSQTQIKRFGLIVGDTISGFLRPPKEGERYFSLLRIESINELSAEELQTRTLFTNLTPVYPYEKLNLETHQEGITGRILNLLAPIGKGQRALVVSPPKAGKTSIMKEVANAITKNHPEVLIKVLLVDERPEEVTDMERSIDGEVIYSTFDEPPEQHVKVSELVLESARRLVECGQDVVILLDSITRLARAYNLVVAPSGRTLSGGLDPSSLHKPKRFFGGARKIENGGSLTIIATALVDTGSRMDDIIYEEFKGTGNMELHLDRKFANRRIFPAINILDSGTRQEQLLIDEDALKKSYLLRKNIQSDNGIEELINLLSKYETNKEFLNSPIFGQL